MEGRGEVDAPPKDHFGDLILDLVGKMRLVHNGQNIIRAFDTQSSETSILDNKDTIIRIAYDGCLVLRNLNDDETKEFDDSIRN